VSRPRFVQVNSWTQLKVSCYLHCSRYYNQYSYREGHNLDSQVGDMYLRCNDSPRTAPRCWNSSNWYMSYMVYNRVHTMESWKVLPLEPACSDILIFSSSNYGWQVLRHAGSRCLHCPILLFISLRYKYFSQHFVLIHCQQIVFRT